MFKTIAFDADDTLWHNETFYIQGKARFTEIFSKQGAPDQIERLLSEIEEHNIALYGYGIKSFMLSMVDAAVNIAGKRLTASQVRSILDLGNQMLASQPQWIEGVEQVLAQLSQHWELMLITKGDAFEQERKIQRSGLAGYFRYIEIVGQKTLDTYRAIFEKYRLQPSRFLMVGNSLKSDILPVLELGGLAVYIPYSETWAHESVEIDCSKSARCYQVESLEQLPGLIESLASSRAVL